MLISENLTKEDLLKNKTRFYWTGALMLFTGFIALWMPLMASFAIELLLGWLLVVAGCAQAYGAYKAFKDKTGGWWEVFSSLCAFVAGFLFITKPLAGVLTLSILLSAYFLVDGVTKIIQYWNIRHIDGAIWTLVSGILAPRARLAHVAEHGHRHRDDRRRPWSRLHLRRHEHDIPRQGMLAGGGKTGIVYHSTKNRKPRREAA